MRAIPVVIAAVAVAFVLVFVWPGLYIYTSTPEGNVYRVNRMTGLRQHATEYGWMAEAEETKRAMRDLEADQLKWQQEILAAVNHGDVARVVSLDGQMEVTYTDDSTQTYRFFPNSGQTILAALRQKNVPVQTSY